MKNEATIIGIGGVARAGKDTFANLAKKSEFFVGKKIRTVSFASALKVDAFTFLMDHCGVSCPKNLTGQDKADIRPFLVWYGCYMRKRNPLHWVSRVSQEVSLDMSTDVFLVTDVRFRNEADWIHSFGGKLVHVKRFQADPFQTALVPPANEEETRNDPDVDSEADAHVRWPTATDDHLDTLQRYVDEALKIILK